MCRQAGKELFDGPDTYVMAVIVTRNMPGDRIPSSPSPLLFALEVK
jgi:hypothetical protein